MINSFKKSLIHFLNVDQQKNVQVIISKGNKNVIKTLNVGMGVYYLDNHLLHMPLCTSITNTLNITINII